MHDVIIVGAGLTGLACAYELEKKGITPTLIEVKPTVGGSLTTVNRDGFLMDTHAYAILDSIPPAYLDELGLKHALLPLHEGVVSFEYGTAQLIDALASRVQAPRMMRMAVSSVGEIEVNGQKYLSVCFENGLMQITKALVLAIPARHAHFVLRSYAPSVSEALADYHYDNVQRVWLGYPIQQMQVALSFRHESGYLYHHRLENSPRTPKGFGMFHIATRIARPDTPHEKLVHYLLSVLGLQEPLFWHVGQWAEADPLSCYDDHHTERLKHIRATLPANIALIGSDYGKKAPPRVGVVRLEERIEQAKNTAKQLVTLLKKG